MVVVAEGVALAVTVARLCGEQWEVCFRQAGKGRGSKEECLQESGASLGRVLRKESSSALKGNLCFPLHPQCSIFHQGDLLCVMTLRIPGHNVEKQWQVKKLPYIVSPTQRKINTSQTVLFLAVISVIPNFFFHSSFKVNLQVPFIVLERFCCFL